jgi:UDP-N-acetylmuramoyl-L-alanyl-D-glutamate--2,6-diaminopimelate ligase
MRYNQRVRVPAPPAWSREILTVGTTGTNGKTTTTSLVAAALRARGGPVLRVTTLGFFVNDEPLDVGRDYDGFLHAMRTLREQGGSAAAIELTSEALSMGFARAWPCRVGVFTNLTHDHLDAHGSSEHYLASKAQLFVSLPCGAAAILNGCDDSSSIVEEVVPRGVHVRRYGVPSRGTPYGALDLEAERVDVDWDGTRVVCKGGFELRVRAHGEVYAENALAAYLAATAAGVPAIDAARAIESARPPSGRFEVIHRRPYVVVDYAHSPDALERTVATGRTLCDREGGTLVVVFGAGGNRDASKREPMGRAARLADRVVLTSDNARDEDPGAIADAIAHGLRGHGSVVRELDRARAIRRAIERASPSDVILLCGKGHETEQLAGPERRTFSDADVAKQVLGRLTLAT